jgi:uncharacterized membrane protein YhaH (DUF805 family)
MKTGRYLSGRGRLSRGQFWFQAATVWLVFYLVWNLLGTQVAAPVVWLVNGVALAALSLLCIRRLHDRNYSGRWLLLAAVPVLGAVWLVWQLAFRRGVPQGNRWGEDPLRHRGDYLVVQ